MPTSIAYLREAKILDGVYEGRWGGHNLVYYYKKIKVVVHTDLGVRGINIQVSFNVKDNKVDEKSITVLKKSIYQDLIDKDKKNREIKELFKALVALTKVTDGNRAVVKRANELLYGECCDC